ncbi:MAG: hypothetical protein DRO88_09225 [Promethearchaeia archaeon]|nr:MAG: hypothetical protein DRO88_09225 [Candidatus Lokiarchaeia archaeon]
MSNNFNVKYGIILSKPHGGSEEFHFDTRTEAENLINRLNQQKLEFKIKVQFPFRTLFAKEIDRLKKASFYSGT